MPDETEDLDYFKLGAYVGFWLRRLVPVNETAFVLSWADKQAFQAGDVSVLTPQQLFFARYGNEIAAFRIAFEIVHYCAVSLAAENAKASVLALLQSTVLVPSERTVREIAVTLKHKNNSPHSLYITLLALFDPMAGVAEMHVSRRRADRS
jgi:hypothetical protein